MRIEEGGRGLAAFVTQHAEERPLGDVLGRLAELEHDVARLARTFPHATSARIDGAAHAPFLSHRGAFDRALDGFLDAR